MDNLNEIQELQNEGLSAEQIKAVTSPLEGLRVIAGAGTGKTTVLTRRIAHLIRNGMSPYHILAITFTNKVAREMRERTAALLPDVDLFDLKICTFLGLCCWILRRECQALDITKDFVIFDDSDQKEALLKVMPKGTARKSPEFKKALEFIAHYKTKGVLPFAVPIEDIETQEDAQYLEWYTGYEKVKTENNALDFDDLIIYAIAILKRPEIGEKYRRRFRHILVDEFQDTNDVQYEVFKLLVGEGKYCNNFFVVGDPDQTIYTWRGANYLILKQRICEDYPQFSGDEYVLKINENFRSTQTILDAANKLIANNENRIKKDLKAHVNIGQDKKVTVVGTATGKDEAKRIVREILSLNTNRNDVAILYRSSYLSLQIETALMEAGIQYSVYGGLKFFDRKEIKDCSAYFCCLVNEKDDIHFQRIINVPRRGIGEKSVATLIEEARNAGISIIQYIREIENYHTELKARAISPLKELVNLMDVTEKRIAEKDSGIAQILNDFIDEIGYKTFLKETEENAEEKLENINEYLNNIKQYFKDNPGSSLTDYLQNVSLTSAQDEIEDAEKVNLMTVHTAKGLEFPYVFIAGFNQDVFPNRKAIDDKKRGGIEEERRLAFVAFTRAKKQLFITYNHDYSYVTGEDKTASCFIEEAGLQAGYTYESQRRQVLFEPRKTTPYGSGRKEYGSSNYGPRLAQNISSQRGRGNANVGLPRQSSDQTNGITWHEGDIAYHKKFGKGTVKSVDGDYVIIVFDTEGEKTLRGSHPSLSNKKE